MNQQKDLEKGYFFGINHEGKLVGAVAGDGKWHECIADHALPLLRWSFVSMTFDSKEGITLFIDGAQHGRKAFSASPDLATEADMVIGKTQTKLTPAFTDLKQCRVAHDWYNSKRSRKRDREENDGKAFIGGCSK